MLVQLCACSAEGQSSQSTASTQTTATAVVSEDEMFTDRDYDSSYDESTAVKINLKDSGSTCTGDGVSISGDTVTISGEGVYIISGSLTNGQITVAADESAKLQLVLSGVQITYESSAALYIKEADKVFVTLAEGTENTLETTGEYIAIDDNNIDAATFSKADTTFNGSGSLTVSSQAGHGIACKNDVKFTDDSYDIDAGDHAVQGKNSIRIAGGSFVLTAAEDGLHSENNDDNAADKGFIYIIGAGVRISTGDDGMHAGTALTIKAGEINITESYEGIEGQSIDISGGDISVKASDDGLNAASGSLNSTSNPIGDDPFAVDESCSITISGGSLKIDAGGDGIDSNGSLTVTGGETYVEGPEDSGNGALDYAGTAEISGGILIALGSSGMAQNFSSASNQGAMLVNVSGSSGSEISVKDSSGATLATYTSSKQFTSAVISCPGIQEGGEYTVLRAVKCERNYVAADLRRHSAGRRTRRTGRYEGNARYGPRRRNVNTAQP